VGNSSRVRGLATSNLIFDSVTVSWIAPAFDGGAPITNYVLQLSQDGTSWDDVIHQTSSDTQMDIHGLKPNTHYQLRVSAVNEAGSSLPSTIEFITPVGPATSPQSPKISSLTSTSLTLSWLLPQSNGGDSIADYLVQVSGNGGASWTVLSHPRSNNLAFDVSNLSKNHVYKFKISAITSYGQGMESEILTVSTLPTVASPPTGLKVSAITGTTVKLEWVVPSDNGGEVISDYQVEFSRDAGRNWVSVAHTASRSNYLSVNGLAPGTTYLIRVAAVNAVGQSEYLTGSVTTLTTTANAPKSLLASGVANSSLVLGWGLPDSNGGSGITDYQVEVTSNGANSWTVIPHAASNRLGFNVSNLLSGRTYQFRVAAVTSAGLGAYSNAITVTTSGGVTPNAPASLKVGTVKTNAASVSWSAVTVTSKVSNYVVDVSTDGSIWTSVSKKVSTSTSLTLSGLKLGTTYQVRVAAVNANGVGDYVYGSFTTLATVSTAPTGLVASGVSGSGSTLNWTAPSSNGGAAITDYVVEINGGGFSWAPVSHEVTGDTSITVSGLNPGIKYSVRVKAVNRVGVSKVSSTLSVTTLAVLPSSPVVTLKSVTATGAVLSWVAPANGGAKISDYKVEYSTDGGNTWLTVSKSASTSTSITLKNLKTKTSYLFRVSAKNSVGYSAPSSNLIVVTP